MEERNPILLRADGSDLSAATAAELAQKVFKAKARRRTWLASLPVEEKYQRFLALQRMAASIKVAAGKPAPRPWPDLKVT
jgi:hypothetical protein